MIMRLERQKPSRINVRVLSAFVCQYADTNVLCRIATQLERAEVSSNFRRYNDQYKNTDALALLDVTQRLLVDVYRRFGTAYRLHRQESNWSSRTDLINQSAVLTTNTYLPSSVDYYSLIFDTLLMF